MAPFTQFLAVSSVGFLLFLSGFMIWMDRGLKPVIARMEREQVITAYLDPALEDKDQGKIIDAIRTSLGARAEVRAVGAEQFLADVRTTHPDLAREIEDLGDEMKTVIPRFISATGLLAPDALEKVKAVQGVESAESSKDRFQNVIGAFYALRRVARILAGGLCVALLIGLLQLSKLNGQYQRDTIGLLWLWGAGSFIVRLPGVISGAVTGLLGGSVAAAAWATAGFWLANHLQQLSPMLHGMPSPVLGIAGILLLAGLFIGVVSAVLHGR
jgi:cell division protein FtsX